VAIIATTDTAMPVAAASVRAPPSLAVTEAMVVIGRLRRDPHADQGGEAGDKIQRSVGKAAHHGGGTRPPCGPDLEAQQ
jgi:hypothetical protein